MGLPPEDPGREENARDIQRAPKHVTPRERKFGERGKNRQQPVSVIIKTIVTVRGFEVVLKVKKGFIRRDGLHPNEDSDHAEGECQGEKFAGADPPKQAFPQPRGIVD